MAYIEIINEEGKVVDTLCTHPVVQCPPSDHLLFRWSMIRYCEEELNKVANHWGGRNRSYYEPNERVLELEREGYVYNPASLFYERGDERIATVDIVRGDRVFGSQDNPLTREEAMNQVGVAYES